MVQQVLTEKILAVVVAIRRANGGVDVLAGGGAAATECDGALMIELNHHDGAVNAVVEDGVGLHVSDPGESGPVELRLHFLHFDPGMALCHVGDPMFDEAHESFLLFGVQVPVGDSGVGDDLVVMKGIGLQVGAVLVLLNHGFFPLGCGER